MIQNLSEPILLLLQIILLFSEYLSALILPTSTKADQKQQKDTDLAHKQDQQQLQIIVIVDYTYVILDNKIIKQNILKMGSSYTKDQNIDLYIGTNKQFYIPGEYVEGEIYLNAKTFRPEYSNICFKIQGHQYVRWTTGSGKNRRTHTGTHQSMKEHRLLVDFHGKVNQGQYQFPFSILLPIMMNGSYYYSQSCYIKYILKVELVHMTEQSKTQRYEMHLNILQPLRSPLGALTVTNSTNSQCCCCKDYGITTVNLNCSKNFAYNGDVVNISGSINNSNGKAVIQRWKIGLQQRRIMISNSGTTRHPIDNQYVFMNDVMQIAAGAVKDFNFNAVIPANITNYTAIGRVTARYFLINLTTEYGCCANTAAAVLHIIIHSRTPMIVQKKQIPPPPNWNPQVYPKIVWNQIKPFIYSPLPQIPYLNLPGQQNVIQKQNQMMNQNQSYDHFNNQIPMNEIPIQNYQGQYQNYQPVYYNQNIFPQLEQQWQGYGQQPYFVNETTEANLVRKL